MADLIRCQMSAAHWREPSILSFLETRRQGSGRFRAVLSDVAEVQLVCKSGRTQKRLKEVKIPHVEDLKNMGMTCIDKV